MVIQEQIETTRKKEKKRGKRRKKKNESKKQMEWKKVIKFLETKYYPICGSLLDVQY